MRFVTLTNQAFVPGVLALVRSIKRNSCIARRDWTVLVDGKLEDRSLEQLKAADDAVEILPTEELGEVKLPECMQNSERAETHIQKLLVWKLPFEERVCFIDADVICVGDARKIESFRHFSAPVVFGITMPRSIYDRPMFSTGLFVFKPDAGLFDELQEFVLAYDYKGGMVDQPIMNKFLYSTRPDEVHLLGIEWEMLKRLYICHPKIWGSIADKKFIHFVGKKPWQGGDLGYGKLEAAWRQYA